MKVLVSFCNRPGHAGDSNLLLVDVSSGRQIWISIDPPNAGVNGIAQDERFVYAALQGDPPSVAIVDKASLGLVSLGRIPEARDPHSLAVNGEVLWVASTGTDQLLQYRLDARRRELAYERVAWSPPGSSQRSDGHHLNAVHFDGRALYVSAFGPKRDERWSSATAGYVFNVSAGRVAVENVYHPHSIFVRRGRVHCCESSTRSVRKGDRVLLRLASGYVRGLHLEGRHLLLGTSSGRKHSKSTGLVNNPADPGMLAQDCRLLVLRRRLLASGYDPVATFDFLPQRKEIYDVALFRPPA